MNRWERTLRALASEFGCSIEQTRSKHWCIRHPTGWRVIASGTPSDSRRTLANIRTMVRAKSAMTKGTP